MTTQPDPDAGKAALAQALKTLNDQWPHELQLIALQAKIIRARHLALMKEGFSYAEALTLCTRKPEL